MRISGITIPDNKRLEIGLTAVFGVGRPRAMEILKETKIDEGKMAKDLTPEEENQLRDAIAKFTTEGDLKRNVNENIKRLKDILAYRGVRHSKHLPTRGQRTKTNSRTSRGNVRRTMTSGKTKLEKK